MQKYDEALEYFEKVIEMTPQNMLTNNSIVYKVGCLLYLNRIDESLKLNENLDLFKLSTIKTLLDILTPFHLYDHAIALINNTGTRLFDVSDYWKLKGEFYELLFKSNIYSQQCIENIKIVKDTKKFSQDIYVSFCFYCNKLLKEIECIKPIYEMDNRITLCKKCYQVEEMENNKGLTYCANCKHRFYFKRYNSISKNYTDKKICYSCVLKEHRSNPTEANS